MPKKITQEDFVARSVAIHGSTYAYVTTVYKRMNAEVIIKCNHHGEFTQLALNHVSGQGCPVCAEKSRRKSCTKTAEQFISAAINVHGDSFDYSHAVYVHSHGHITIGCKTCQSKFSQQAYVHLNGAGCPSCKTCGYKCSMPGYLYVLEAGNITKVGITNRNVSERLRDINRCSGLLFTKVAAFYFENGNVPRQIETNLLAELRGVYKPIRAKFDGSTECFIDVDRASLVERLSLLQ